MDKPQPARDPLWLDHISHPRLRPRHPMPLDWMAIPLRLTPQGLPYLLTRGGLISVGRQAIPLGCWS